jgi:hypothetical protein
MWHEGEELFLVLQALANFYVLENLSSTTSFDFSIVYIYTW